ncbi:MAG TPA: hypothetical protein VFB36_00045 [Nevskiaceae bacterium]|nr:hypothetical protein [Nevskiaceae bacterium]
MSRALDARISRWIAGLVLVGSALAWQPAHAVPSYARQMGMACSGCHTTIPELNAFGRQFKLTGYTMTTADQVKSEKDLSINRLVPFSLMLETGFTHVQKTVPDTQNNDVQFPQQLSLFYSGRISDKLGAFSQLTYDQPSDKFNWDNTDIRYATMSGSAIYGATLNNAPTVEDLWNSTNVWGFPFAGSATAPTPTASSLIDRLAQDSIGLGAFGMWQGSYYADVTLYRSTHLGQDQPNADSTSTISGVAPYWRLAWQRSFGGNTVMIGTYGMQASEFPQGVSGPKDQFTDVAVDAQYERSFGMNAITAHAAYLRESMKLEATDPGNRPKASFMRLDATYHLDTQAAFSAGYQGIAGDATPFWGTASGKPNSTAFIVEASHLPWQNTKFSVQYAIYTKFDGTKSDYDGAGRSASDNNTLYVLAWLLL